MRNVYATTARYAQVRLVMNASATRSIVPYLAYWKPVERRISYSAFVYVMECTQGMRRRRKLWECWRRLLRGLRGGWFSGGHATKSCCYPLLSTGQCIELIESKTNKMGLQFYSTTCDWHVWLGNYTAIDNKHSWIDDEIIVSLWQAVINVL